MCEQEPHFIDMCGVLTELQESGALNEQQMFTFYSTLQDIGERLERLDNKLKPEAIHDLLMDMYND